jgi:hypothetical protein
VVLAPEPGTEYAHVGAEGINTNSARNEGGR